MSEARHAVVVWVAPGGTERRCRFVDRCAIGRDPASRILVDSAGASRAHALLELRASGLFVRNVSVANSVGLGVGRRLGPGEEVALAPGDLVEVADARVRVLLVHLPAVVVSLVCARADCGREVPSSASDCPWCGTSMAFAHTSLGARSGR